MTCLAIILVCLVVIVGLVIASGGVELKIDRGPIHLRVGVKTWTFKKKEGSDG